MTKWKPFETAPHSSGQILVCNMNQGGVKRIISWNGVHGRWEANGVAIVSPQDTHWAPIDEVNINQ